MNRNLTLTILGAAVVAAAALSTVSGAAEKKPVAPALNFKVKDIDGKEVALQKYQGQVLLVVNVASYCGNTKQYTNMQAIYEKYGKQGFSILAFPANDFGKQEPGSEKEIKEFCNTKYKTTFPMFSKVVVKGEGQTPFYSYLTSKETNPSFGGDVEWNFAKFLLDRNGKVIARFPAKLDPGSPEVVAAIEKALAEK
ncbi:MAG: glutathione peroxidase [Actinomycetota bacterium]